MDFKQWMLSNECETSTSNVANYAMPLPMITFTAMGWSKDFKDKKKKKDKKKDADKS